MTRLARLITGALLLAAPGLARERQADLELTLTATELPLADLAVAAGEPAGPGLALLTLGPGGDKSQPGRLLFVPLGQETPTALAAELPPGLTSLATSPLGLLLGRPGEILRLGPAGVPIRLAASPGLDLLSVAGGRRGLAGGPVVARAGRLTRYDVTDGGLVPGLSAALPTTVSRALFGLRIESPPVTLLAATAGAPALAVAGPLATGTRRLQSQVVDLEGGAAHEAWSLLPADERLVGASFDRLGDRPVLLVSTLEQLGLLVEKRVRMFSLPPDRTRRGAPPLLAFATDCPLWGTLTNHLADIDGDGVPDLVTIYSHGLTLGSLTVEVRRGRASGGFDAEPRRAELDVEGADWRFREDWTGDGRPDLVVLTEGDLRLFPGTPDAQRPVSARPRNRFVTVPGTWGEDARRERTLELGRRGATIAERGPQLVALDLDGDGRNELVAVTPGKEGRTAVAVLRWAPAK